MSQYLLTFADTHQAIAAEDALLAQNFSVRIIPLPSAISASCGLALRFPADLYPTVPRFLQETHFPYHGLFLISEENGKKSYVYCEEKLSSLLQIDKGDVVSIVGAGGKTTTLLRLAKELRSKKVLVSTTTKMGDTGMEVFDHSSIQQEPDMAFLQNSEPGLYFAAAGRQDAHKYIGFSPESLASILPHFDIALLEADGSRQKPLKGWKNSEPVIVKQSTKTLGILTLSMIGRPLSGEYVHNPEFFQAITGAQMGDICTAAHIRALIMHPNGLFQYARGEKLLFLNQIDDAEQMRAAEAFLCELPRDDLSAIIAGSAQTGFYRRIV